MKHPLRNSHPSAGGLGPACFQATEKTPPHSFKLLTAGAALLGILGAVSAQAVIIDLTFSGTYDTGGFTVFGQSGAAVPYSYQITYDTSLDTNPFFFATGAALGSVTTAHEWHAYSVSGVIATSLTFGTKTFTAADLVPRLVAVGVSADLWFDTDLSVAIPTLSWILFENASSELQIGGGLDDFGVLSLIASSFIHQGPGATSRRGDSDNLRITGGPGGTSTSVPDAGSTLPLLGLAFAGLAWFHRRQTSKQGKPLSQEMI